MGAPRTRHFPRPLLFLWADVIHNSGASCRENANAHSIVIAQLDRAIQYSETSGMETESCGVLDTRLRGYDG